MLSRNLLIENLRLFKLLIKATAPQDLTPLAFSSNFILDTDLISLYQKKRGNNVNSNFKESKDEPKGNKA
jgi:hypothetical protein